jgi:hypothetical protein
MKPVLMMMEWVLGEKIFYHSDKEWKLQGKVSKTIKHKLK